MPRGLAALRPLHAGPELCLRTHAVADNLGSALVSDRTFVRGLGALALRGCGQRESERGGHDTENCQKTHHGNPPGQCKLQVYVVISTRQSFRAGHAMRRELTAPWPRVM